MKSKMKNIILSAIERRGQSQEGISVRYIRLFDGKGDGDVSRQFSPPVHPPYHTGNLRRIVSDFPDMQRSCNDCY